MHIPPYFICMSVIALTCTFSSCTSRQDHQPDQEKILSTSDSEYKDRVQAIEAEIDQLLSQLQGSSRGAYTQGPRLITGTAGDETLLDRLYNAENTLVHTRVELGDKQQSIATLKKTVINNSLLIKSLELKAELYEKNRDKILTLQDDRKHSLSEISDLRSSLIEAELKLLTLQSDHFNFARKILELEPGDTQGFLDLQEQMKQMTLELGPREKNRDNSAATGTVTHTFQAPKDTP